MLKSWKIYFVFLGPICLNIISDRDCITLNNCSNKFTIQNLNTNTNEILIEYTANAQHKSPKDHVAFQVQIKTCKSIRIITKQISLQPADSMSKISKEHLIHVFSLRKLSQLCMESRNMLNAKDFLRKYQAFLQTEATGKTNLCDVVVKLINRLPMRQSFRFLNDCDAQVLYNNKNLTVGEFLGIEEKQTAPSISMDASQDLVPIESITLSQDFIGKLCYSLHELYFVEHVKSFF